MNQTSQTLCSKIRSFLRKKYVACSLVVALGVLGCSSPTPQITDVTQVGTIDNRFDNMLTSIRQAQMPEWYEYGHGLQDKGHIRLVTTRELSPEFNAFSWIDKECIWYSEIAFQRYDEIDRGEILLHELGHCKTKEITHTLIDPVCAEYRKYYNR